MQATARLPWNSRWASMADPSFMAVGVPGSVNSRGANETLSPRLSCAFLRLNHNLSVGCEITTKTRLTPTPILLRAGPGQEFLGIQVYHAAAEQVRRHRARQWLAVDRHLDPFGIADPHGEPGLVR